MDTNGTRINGSCVTKGRRRVDRVTLCSLVSSRKSPTLSDRNFSGTDGFTYKASDTNTPAPGQR
jgi:hypothetical protein